jgi:hypothetical protein
MRKLRFNISRLLLVVLVVAVGFAALREANKIWDSTVFTFTVGVLLISILLAAHRSEKRWAFWLGFALFGSTYLGLSLVPSIESRMGTTKPLAGLHAKMSAWTPAGAGVAFGDLDNDGDIDIFVANSSQPSFVYRNNGNGKFVDVSATSGLSVVVDGAANGRFFVKSLGASSGTTENFVRIGHSLFALVAAFVGGLISRRIHATN